MSDATCKCGHTSENHSGRCIFGGAGWCDCEAFDPQTADRDDLAVILAKHEWCKYGVPSQPPRWWPMCSCGESFRNLRYDQSFDAHRAHVAQMVLESDWLRGVRAKELRDAADAIRAKERGVDDYGAHYMVDAKWIEDRAAGVGTKDGDDEAPHVHQWRTFRPYNQPAYQSCAGCGNVIPAPKDDR